MTKLDIDVNAKLQQPRGFIGYPEDDQRLAVEIFTHNRDDIRLKANVKRETKKSNTGLYLGSAAAMGVLALAAYAYNKRGQKTVAEDPYKVSSDPTESFAFHV